MQSNTEFQSLLRNLITDVQETSVLWQIAVLAASLGLAWLLQRQFERRFPSESRSRRLNISMQSMSRLMFPLFALALVIPGRWVLSYWYPTHLLNILVPLLFALALIRVTVYILRRVFSSQKWLHPWELFIGWTVWIGLALYITGLLPEILDLLDNVGFHIGKQRLSVLLIAQGVLAFTASILVALWMASAFETRIMDAKALDINQRVILSKMSRSILIVAGVLIALPMVGVDITVLSVFGGALGVGLGFGLQKIASNYISGYIILLDRSLHIGDTVAVDNRKGEVVSLTTRYVVLKTEDGTEALIPNDTFITSTVVRQTYANQRLRLIFTDTDQLLQPGRDGHEHHAASREGTAANIGGTGTCRYPQGIRRERCHHSDLIIWVQDPEGGVLRLRSSLHREILAEFEKNGIRFARSNADGNTRSNFK